MDDRSAQVDFLDRLRACYAESLATQGCFSGLESDRLFGGGLRDVRDDLCELMLQVAGRSPVEDDETRLRTLEAKVRSIREAAANAKVRPDAVALADNLRAAIRITHNRTARLQEQAMHWERLVAEIAALESMSGTEGLLRQRRAELDVLFGSMLKALAEGPF